MITNKLRRWLAEKKDVSPEAMAEWDGLALCSLLCLLTSRVLRGIGLRLRGAQAKGLVLCERRVRVYHPRGLQSGRALNLEEGCEIVALAKQGIVFGDRCTVGRGAIIRPTNVLLDEAGEGMRMGSSSNIGALSYIGCSGFVDIGSRVLMGPRVSLLAENHQFDDGGDIKSQGVDRLPIRIEDDCWIGAGVTVVAGVTIGAGSVVAAGAVVTKDVAPGSVVGGVPARLIRERQP